MLQDKWIPLLSGSAPTNVRPYQSIFFTWVTSTQKDSSWQMCVGYQVLNDINVEDKYLISVIKELLDELGGAH